MTQALATERFMLTTASYYPEKSEMLAKIRFSVSSLQWDSDDHHSVYCALRILGFLARNRVS